MMTTVRPCESYPSGKWV